MDKVKRFFKISPSFQSGYAKADNCIEKHIARFTKCCVKVFVFRMQNIRRWAMLVIRNYLISGRDVCIAINGIVKNSKRF